MSERAIFTEALERPTPAERAAFLDAACAGDPALRDRVDALLRSHDGAGEFLKGSVPERLAGGPLAAETRTGPAAPDGGEGLDFLVPSDKPGVLGRLGHYEVQEVVGRGGMGVVLKAFDEKLHRVVAVKVMAPQLAASAAARQRFTREARAAAAVTHDHIVTIHAVEETNGLPYIVMQFVDGVTLQDRIDRSGSLPLAEILRIGMQAASGLAAAHAQGIVHRDVKPANILLENGVERVKLTDFGLARADDDASLTQSGTVAGTPSFMSPEQAEGKPVDHRSDLFSLGSVLYAMCAGRPPFRASTGMGVLKRVCEETPTRLREINPEMPAWLVAVVEKLHAKDPVLRFQSAAEVAELVGRHLAHVQHPSVVPLRVVVKSTAGPTTLVRPRHQKRWVVAAAVLVAILAVLGTTEATGVTNVRATVTRILTPDGTLVVETDDPNVKITVEGDGGLVITGAGLQEIRLRPGSYRVLADREGKRVPLDRELVTVSRGDRAIIRVMLESPATPSAPTAEKGAFVLLAAGAERKFDTLAEAVLTSADADTIEIRGNGPFVMEPVRILRPLTIRAGEGFRPVLRFTPGMPGDDYLINASAPLVLEGLDIREVSKMRSQPTLVTRSVILSDANSLHLANCRVWQEEPVREAVDLILANSNVILRNCEFRTKIHVLSFGNGVPARRVIDNCVGLGGAFVFLGYGDASNAALVEMRDSTVVMLGAACMSFSVAPDPPHGLAGEKRVRFEASNNVFALPPHWTLLFNTRDPFRERANWQQPADAEAFFMSVVGWGGNRNAYSRGAASICWEPRQGDLRPLSPGTLKDWQRRWKLTDPDSVEGIIVFEGGDLPNKALNLSEKLTTADFRLRSDSAGYRAGKDGKDLGADLDLVGTGAAYERWKKSPEYQQWLKETGQLNK